MEIWLDTTKPQTIEEAERLGILHGVTTNPSLIAKSKRPFKDILRNLLTIQPGPITAQVLATDADGMIEQARRLRKFSKRIVIKIPATKAGYEACHRLSDKRIPVMMTAVFNANQVLLSGLAGATYVAPYLGRIQKRKEDPIDVIESMADVVEEQRLDVKILAASIKQASWISDCAEREIAAITLPERMYKAMLKDPGTEAAVETFAKDWKKSKKEFI